MFVCVCARAHVCVVRLGWCFVLAVAGVVRHPADAGGHGAHRPHAVPQLRRPHRGEQRPGPAVAVHRPVLRLRRVEAVLLAGVRGSPKVLSSKHTHPLPGLPKATPPMIMEINPGWGKTAKLSSIFSVTLERDMHPQCCHQKCLQRRMGSTFESQSPVVAGDCHLPPVAHLPLSTFPAFLEELSAVLTICLFLVRQ